MRLIFILTILLSQLSAQEYLWPTNASNYLSSSFCEYRPGHYHAAIDIKTWNREGYPCYAVADGRVERIRISPFGAGKALYIKLNDGNTAVYFHLQKFTDSLENKIRLKQQQEKRYSIEWWPQNLYVKKGEIIAYSGQTGIGVPHLHFEIRDKKNTPVNPLQYYPQVKDAVRPRLDQLLFIPQDEKSTVNGSFLPQIISLKKIKTGEYVPENPVKAKGRIGVAIKGYDQADGVGNKLAFYNSELWINGRQVFSQSYDKISFSDTRMVDIDIFYPEKARSGKRFNKLFIEPFNTLQFYQRELGDGIFNVIDTSVAFEIRIKDYFGNTSKVIGAVSNWREQETKLSQATVMNETAYLKLLIPEKLSGLEFFSGVSAQVLDPVDYFEIIERQPSDDGALTLLKLKLAKPGDRFIRSVIKQSNGRTDSSLSVIEPQKNNSVRTRLQLLGKYLYFQFLDLNETDNLNISFKQQDSIFSDHLNFNGTVAEYVLPAKRIISENIRVKLTDTQSLYADTLISVSKILPRENQTFSFFGDSLVLRSRNESVYDTLLFRVSKNSISDTLFDLPLWGDVYSIDAGDQILSRGITMAIKSDSSFYSDGRAAIFSYNKDEINYSGGKPDFGNYIKKRTKTLNSYIIAADTVAPEITVITPQSGIQYQSMPLISFKVKDDISGVGSDKNIEVYFDDEFIVPEWDPERDLVKAELHFSAAPGDHKIRITVKDQVGNAATRLINFKIR